MDFDAAAARLRSDHETLRSRARNRKVSRNLASTVDKAKAQRAREFRQKQIEKKRQIEKLEKQKFEFGRGAFNKVERNLSIVRSLSKESGNDSRVMLEATSIHGQGDKITLPESILFTLTDRDLLQKSQDRGQPLFFRLAIRRENYSFPASDSFKQIIEGFGQKREARSSSSFDDSDMDDDDDDELDKTIMQSYLNELAEEYITYTYASVVEFSEEEGCIGLSVSAANALLRPIKKDIDKIESKFTVDPAAASLTQMEEDGNPEPIQKGEKDQSSLEEKTPGHTAYGEFPIPAAEIEVTLLANLPLGIKCTLQPTHDAIKNGFYDLKNVKLALEQSFVRTRGCLNVTDMVHCWFRGKKFDLIVKDVTPGDLGAISCVNTDIEVNIAAVEEEDDNRTKSTDSDMEVESTDNKNSAGYRLSDNRDENCVGVDVTSQREQNKVPSDFQREDIELPSEPPKGRIDNVVLIQLRGDGGKMSQRRRFDTTTTNIKHLFGFALTAQILDDDENAEFRLVTRFPRRVFHLTEDGDKHLNEIDLSNQELFLVERC